MSNFLIKKELVFIGLLLCGLCVTNCPNNLEIYKIVDLVDAGQIEKATKYSPHKCFSCGISVIIAWQVAIYLTK